MEILGLSCLIYNDMMHKRARDYEFCWTTALAVRYLIQPELANFKSESLLQRKYTLLTARSLHFRKYCISV